jgi:hypothetical protein
MSVVIEQQNKQFSIKPSYTYYTGRASKSAPHDCRMRVFGDYNAESNKWDDTELLPPTSPEWNINSHWSNPPIRSAHFYKFKTVFDVMQDTFGQFNQKEAKTVAKWDFTIPCIDNDNTPQRSSKVYYAESGCTQQTCVDFITKPCYDNIYRYDEMVCTLIDKVFPGGAVKFSTFKEKIIPQVPQRAPFMSYGSSYFDIWYDAAKVVVRRGGDIVQPNTPTIFADDHTISVALVRDAINIFSCKACFDLPLHGRFSSADNAMDNDITKCRLCYTYEKTKVTASVKNYQDCEECARHQVRNPDKATECRKCKEMDALTPMRRTAPLAQVCTTCQHFQYFDDATDEGCRFLQVVTDGIRVVTLLNTKKAALSGKDYYIQDDILKEIDSKFRRDNINANTTWNTELVPQPCIPTPYEPATVVKRLKFTAWCGHHEMVRKQQAWLRLRGGMLYLPLNSDPALTHVNTSVVELCGNSSLTQVRGSTTGDLQCGERIFSIIREGFSDPCALCLGAKYTQNCWPTYVPGLEVYDDAYFLPSNKALAPQPGTCEHCNARCDNNRQADHFIDPIEYSCWWNGIGRIPGLLGSTATTFSWYKPAPCTKCGVVKLTDGKAQLVLACGNRVSYRRWLADTVSGSELDARSIPSIQICCVEKLDDPLATICTDAPAKFETFTQLNCRQTVDDTPPALLPYCPPLWYVDEACARDSPLWNPDCCVKCKPCRGGLFKLDAYYDCPGDEYFDSQDRGCTTKCLTNQYLRNERCIKCEACE